MKKLLFIIVLICSFFVFPQNTYALEINQTGYVNKNGVLFKSEPNYNGESVLDTLDTGDEIKIIDANIIASTDSSKCNLGFYKISFYWENYNKKTYTGYVCGDYINFDIDVTPYGEEFASSNIPESYWKKLALLKKSHPNWKFTGYKTNLDWNEVINVESQVGMSYIQTSNPIYLSLEEGSYNVLDNSYNQMEAGGWYAANKQTVAYYMDPRNFLNEVNIFMFENLGYNEKYQTEDVILNIFSGTDLAQYSSIFLQAGKENNISPISLAARSRQEVVLGNGKLSDSANGSLFKNTNVYNFYNIGAYSSCDIDGTQVANPVMCGLKYAYNNGWITPEKAIFGGAEFISDDYIKQGQNTFYFQKFNVTSYYTYSHQYMTNIMAPLSESESNYTSYNKIGKLDSSIEFLIPVYNNMPADTTSLPTTVDKSQINEIKNNASLNEIISKAGYSSNNQYIDNIPLDTTAMHMITAIKSAGGNATITTDGKEISGQEKLGTGDIINITDGNETKSYRIVIKGDANGDGSVDAIDYVKIYKYIMDEGNLTGSYGIAADVNKDGSTDAVDYVKLYKYIMDGGQL